jgi:hypothetical protein
MPPCVSHHDTSYRDVGIPFGNALLCDAGRLSIILAIDRAASRLAFRTALAVASVQASAPKCLVAVVFRYATTHSSTFALKRASINTRNEFALRARIRHRFFRPSLSGCPTASSLRETDEINLTDEDSRITSRPRVALLGKLGRVKRLLAAADTDSMRCASTLRSAPLDRPTTLRPIAPPHPMNPSLPVLI